MYAKSACFYDSLYHFKDYGVATVELRQLIERYRPGTKTLLDVGCGTGRHVELLQEDYEVQGLDINPALLEVARGRCPHIPFHEGDMMDFDLNIKFDVVTCLFAVIAYAKTVGNLNRALATMAGHLNPGGLFFVEPWLTPEQYWTDNVVLNVADKDPKEKIVWMYVGKVDGTVVTNEIEYMIGTPEGVSHFSETHQMGLYTQDDYTRAMDKARLEVLQEDPRGFFGNGLYVATLKVK